MTAQHGLPTMMRRIRDALGTGLIEREIPIRLALLAAVSGSHLLLVGPPGTAKSELARRLHLAVRGGGYFERLLTRFSVPEELFGPLSLKKLEQDEYHRLTKGYLPSATIAFLDEILKANSAILNSLLTQLNEREFDNGAVREKTPLICVIGASNELPEGVELAALYDRFLLRFHVGAVSDVGFERLLALRSQARPSIGDDAMLTPQLVEWIRSEAERVHIGQDVIELLKAMRKFLAEQQISVSDRRWRQVVHLLQVSAYTNGRLEVSIWDCWLLQHCLWSDPEERETISNWFDERVGSASPTDPERLKKLVAGLEKRLEKERTMTTPQTLEDGRPLYLANPRTAPGSYLGIHEGRHVDATLIPTATPLMRPAEYSEHHINGRVQDARKLHDELTAQVAGLRQHADSVSAEVANHLWVDPRFGEVARRNLDAAATTAIELQKRAAACVTGFQQLPVQTA